MGLLEINFNEFFVHHMKRANLGALFNLFYIIGGYQETSLHLIKMWF